MEGFGNFGESVGSNPARSAQNRLATIRLPYAGPTTGLKSAKCRLYERRLLADFRPVVGPAYGSRMVANQIRADRAHYKYLRGHLHCHFFHFFFLISDEILSHTIIL